ncbi:uncharacterized protein LOC106151074 [Lingula anatina]|uniref:Uncharacterized protein LOC106151074 n=1 Tax=Lingula anatina TaxID=7574 RepID=A0A1S3H0U1_LINAN|nr:uncharacterized protein LOC106151074 [Lingula anatina]|eukprot:XP_013379618.1 uncharacterized protein LOC106151074 [Lingula anatina]
MEVSEMPGPSVGFSSFVAIPSSQAKSPKSSPNKLHKSSLLCGIDTNKRPRSADNTLIVNDPDHHAAESVPPPTEKMRKNINVLRSKLNECYLRQEETLVALKRICITIENALGGSLRWNSSQYKQTVKDYFAHCDEEDAMNIAQVSISDMVGLNIMHSNIMYFNHW